MNRIFPKNGGDSMSVAQSSVHWKRLREPEAIPGWLILGWKLLNAISNVDYLKQHIAAVWQFCKTPVGNVLLIFGGLAWLAAVVLWPRQPREPENSEKHEPENTTSSAEVLVQAEAKARAGDIASVYKTLWENVAKINRSLDHLAHKPEPTLKQRTTQLANELFALLQKLGPEPPDPLSLPPSERNTVAKQLLAQNAYSDWQRSAYYNYRAHFRNRVIQIDDELAASKIFIKLDDQEIDPPKNNGEIKLKKIAETLLLTAQQMP